MAPIPRSIVAPVVWAFATVALAQSPAEKPAEPAARDHSGEPFVVSSMTTTYRFDAEGTGTRSFKARVRVQTEGGVQRLGRLVLDYDSESERLTFSGRVVKADGTTITIPESAAQDMSWPVSTVAPMYSDLRQRHIIVPSLRPGDILEYETQVERFAAFAPHQFWLSHDFEKEAIVEEESLLVDVPSSSYVNIKSKPGVQPATEDKDGRRVYRWTSSHLEREPDPDPSADEDTAAPADAVPDVQVSTFRTWKEIGDWYAALEKDKRVPDEGLRIKAKDLTKNATTDLEKLQAIYDFVAKEFRYVSLSFGIGRYQPHSASLIFADQYGDCKDKHTLLAALAAASGLDVRAALTSGSRKVDESFPSPAQFDHVISYVTIGGQAVWLDTTTELAPFRVIVSAVRGKSALVVKADGGSELKTVPIEPLVPNGLVAHVEGAISELGALDVKVTLTLQGDADVLGRLGVRSVPQPRWKDLMQIMASSLGTFGDVSDVEISDILDTRKPLVYRFHVTKQNYLNRFESNPQLILPLGSTSLPDPKEKTGQSLVELGAMRTEYHARLELPKRFQARLPLLVDQKRDFGSYASHYAMEGTTLIADRTMNVTVAELPASRLSEFRAFRRTVIGDSEQKVGVKVAEGAGSADGGEVKTSELLVAAHAAFDNGKFQDAAALMERVVRSEPNHKTAYNDLGQAYLALGDYEKAEKALTKASEIDPFSPSAFGNLGRVLRAQRRYDAAEKAFRKQIEIDPLGKSSHDDLGHMLLEQEKFGEAEAELAKAIAVTPENPDLYASLGHAQLSQHKVEDALGSFDRAIEVSPSPPVWNNVADSLAENATDLDRAQDYAESAVRVLAATLRGVRLDTAKEQELELVRLLGACWDTLGWIYFRKGDLTPAERYLRSSWQLLHTSAVADHLGQLYVRLGRKDEAIEYFAYATLDDHPAVGGRQHLAALVGEAKVASTLSERRKRPAVTPKFEVPRAQGQGDASFFVLLAPGNVVDDVRFVSGNESLRALGDVLKALPMEQEFPDQRDTRILRKGTLSCAPANRCQFALEPLDLVASSRGPAPVSR